MMTVGTHVLGDGCLEVLHLRAVLVHVESDDMHLGGGLVGHLRVHRGQLLAVPAPRRVVLDHAIRSDGFLQARHVQLPGGHGVVSFKTIFFALARAPLLPRRDDTRKDLISVHKCWAHMHQKKKTPAAEELATRSRSGSSTGSPAGRRCLCIAAHRSERCRRSPASTPGAAPPGTGCPPP